MYYCVNCKKCLVTEIIYFYLDETYCEYCCPWNRNNRNKSQSNLYLCENIYESIVKKFHIFSSK